LEIGRRVKKATSQIVAPKKGDKEMKKQTVTISILVLSAMLIMPALNAGAEEMHHAGAAVSDKVSLESIKAHPAEGKEGVIELNNEICPVGGDKVSGKDSFVHEGVNYQICCPMCAGKFKNNLSKYAHSAAEVKEFMMNQKPNAS
jgi:hypothetical protein